MSKSVISKVAPVLAPCGHPGTYVIGQFINCTVRGCDGLPPFAAEEPTPRLDGCPKCGSQDIAPFKHPWNLPNNLYHCLPCGAVFDKSKR